MWSRNRKRGSARRRRGGDPWSDAAGGGLPVDGTCPPSSGSVTERPRARLWAAGSLWSAAVPQLGRGCAETPNSPREYGDHLQPCGVELFAQHTGPVTDLQSSGRFGLLACEPTDILPTAAWHTLSRSAPYVGDTLRSCGRPAPGQ